MGILSDELVPFIAEVILFVCLPRTTRKTWELEIKDVNSGSVHLHIVSDYSTNTLLQSLRRFGSLHGWLNVLQEVVAHLYW